MTGQVITHAGFAYRSEQREREVERWRRRSRLILLLRVAFPGAIVMIVLLFGLWLAFGGRFGPSGKLAGGPGSIHMTNAKFLGRDNQGRAFVLTAADAERDNFDLRKIEVLKPTLTIDPGQPDATVVSADHGVYREDNRMLMLNGRVAVRDGQGDHFATDQAIVDTVKGAVAGETPITGSGPMGEIHAQSYAIYDRGARLVFQGKVHSRITRR